MSAGGEIYVATAKNDGAWRVQLVVRGDDGQSATARITPEAARKLGSQLLNYADVCLGEHEVQQPEPHRGPCRTCGGEQGIGCLYPGCPYGPRAERAPC